MVRTKRWNEPPSEEDGRRLLVTRYRPRGVTRERETWDAWLPHLAPSRDLHAAAYGKGQPPITWDVYRARYCAEMAGQRYWIEALASQSAGGEVLTLLCSSACIDEARCHRSLLAELILGARGGTLEPLARGAAVIRRKPR